MNTVHFSEIEARVIPTLPSTLVHHHVTITLMHMDPEKLACFFGDVPPQELRLHFWTTGAGFPANAVRFCTHLSSEQTVYYNGTEGTIEHNPELVEGGPPSGIACGYGPTGFMVRLNRLVWEELQNPVQGLTALRVAVLTRVAPM